MGQSTHQKTSRLVSRNIPDVQALMRAMYPLDLSYSLEGRSKGPMPPMPLLPRQPVSPRPKVSIGTEGSPEGFANMLKGLIEMGLR